jgi:predicted transposase/invertase (TIGR01784 family)
MNSFAKNIVSLSQNSKDKIMAKYLDPKADLTFKKIFGEHKNLVISLLNALLPLKDDERVESIEYWPAEKIPDRTEAEKYSIVDVCCKDNKKREFIVEMQMSWTESFKKRVLLNASKAYVAQTAKGMKYSGLQPVYALNFVNAIFLEDVDDYYHYYHLVHDKYTDRVIDGLHLIFVELPKFKPQSFSERKMQILWLRFLTEINENTKEVPAELKENAEVNQALEIVEIAAFSDEEMRAYDKFWDRVSTQRTYEEEIKQKAEEEANKRANKRVEEANKRANKRVEEANKRANKRVEEAIKKLEEKAEEKIKEAQSEAKAIVEEAKAKAEEAEAKAEEAEAKAEEAEAKAKAKAEQQKIDTARKMKADGLPFELIAKYTGITIKEIEAL